MAVNAHVEGLGLNRFLGVRLSELSTGTQRKVWLVAALVTGSAAVLPESVLRLPSREH